MPADLHRCATNAYDLSRPESWQKLSVDFRVPEYNTRNYLALNTRTREAIDVLMYFDDISIVPSDLAAEETCTYLELDPQNAALGGGVRLQPPADFPQRAAIQGRGTASWQVHFPAAGTYLAWLRAYNGGNAPSVSVGETEIAAPADIAEPTWHSLGKVDLAAGDHAVTIKLSDGTAIVGGLVFTTDPTIGIALSENKDQ